MKPNSFSKSPFSKESFIFQDQIGVGKYGRVYKAVDRYSEVVVALKQISKKIITSNRLYKQLQRQIEIQSRLKHPNICQLYGYFHDQNNVYLVLEFCQNDNLVTAAKQNQLSQKKIASIFYQLAHAVAFMQKRNVMHRDIKLENILLDGDYNPKITDFGCSIHTGLSRKSFLGTLEYVCPQMVRKEPYNHSIDVYCLGILLYELFFSKSPFVDVSEEATLNNIQNGRVIFDNSRLIPEQAKDLIVNMLAKQDKRIRIEQVLDCEFIRQYKVVKNSPFRMGDFLQNHQFDKVKSRQPSLNRSLDTISKIEEREYETETVNQEEKPQQNDIVRDMSKKEVFNEEQICKQIPYQSEGPPITPQKNPQQIIETIQVSTHRHLQSQE